jgi:SAM-dependent methyltransferase
MNLENYAISTLKKLGKLPAEASVLDVGTADAALYDRLTIEFEHKGPFWGIDPNTNQFSDLTKIKFTPEDWLRLKKSNIKLPIDLDSLAALQTDQQTISAFGDNLILKEGRANDLSDFSDNSVDTLFAMSMLYHVPQQEREQAYKEFKRVVKPEGAIMIATSGINNKRVHRELEAQVAQRLGIFPPKLMNASFTTEKAEQELPKHFDYVYMFKHKSEIQIGIDGISAYMRSQKSLRDQYHPIPGRGEFDAALYRIVVPRIAREIIERGYFIDEAHRSLILASNQPIPGADTHNFELIS